MCSGASNIWRLPSIWPTTKPNIMTPVTAMTTFLPLVDCQKVMGSVRCGVTSVVLINLSQPCGGGASSLRGRGEPRVAESRKVQFLPFSCLLRLVSGYESTALARFRVSRRGGTSGTDYCYGKI